MGLLSDRQWFVLAVVGYGLSMVYSVFLWRKGFRQDNRVTYCVLGLAFLAHTLSMMERGFSLRHCPVTNLFEATTFVGWTIVASYLALGLWSRVRFLGAFASPLLFAVGVFALMPGLDLKGTEPRFVNGPVSLHASLILLSYGAFGLSSIAAVMFLTQENDLRYHKTRAVLSLLPPIERLEKVTSWLLLAGLILLTLGLGMAPLLMRGRPGSDLYGDPKILWSVFVWVLYLALVLWRWRFGQRGRRLAWGAIASFTFVILTFWGTNLMSRIHQ